MNKTNDEEKQEVPEKRQIKIHYEKDEGEGLYQSIKFNSFEELGQIEDYIEKKRREKEEAIDLTGLNLSQENCMRISKFEKRLESLEKTINILSDRIDALEQLIKRISELQD